MNKRIVSLILFFFLFQSVNIYSQIFGISASQMWSDEIDFKKPAGFNINLQQYLFRNGKLNFEYSYYRYNREAFGIVFSSLNDGNNIEEKINGISYLHTLEFSLNYDLINSNKIKFGFGGGFLIANINRKIESHLTKNISKYEDTRFGLEGAAFIEKSLSSKFNLFFIAKMKFITGASEMVTESSPPFLEAINFNSLQTELSYNFSK